MIIHTISIHPRPRSSLGVVVRSPCWLWAKSPNVLLRLEDDDVDFGRKKATNTDGGAQANCDAQSRSLNLGSNEKALKITIMRVWLNIWCYNIDQ